MTRVIHIKDAPKGFSADTGSGYVYIGRRSDVPLGSIKPGENGYFGNPFRLRAGQSRGETLDKFEAWARERIAGDAVYLQQVRSLYGKTLVCFCAPSACHGDVLAKLAMELQYRCPTAKLTTHADEVRSIRTFNQDAAAIDALRYLLPVVTEDEIKAHDYGVLEPWNESYEASVVRAALGVPVPDHILEAQKQKKQNAS